MSDLPPPSGHRFTTHDPYHPRNVVVSRDQFGAHVVTDYTQDVQGSVRYAGKDRERAEYMARKRQAVVKGARTRRARKRAEEE